MTDTKSKILGFQDEIIDVLNDSKDSLSVRMDYIRQKTAMLINSAKKDNDGLTQLYCCMVEANINSFSGEKNELINNLAAITKTDRIYLLAKEKNITYPANTQTLDADTYGLYYALNDHYSKQWDNKNYRLAKNGSQGNPLITNLIKLMYENSSGKPMYKISNAGHLKIAVKSEDEAHNQVRDRLFESFKKHDTKVFSDLNLAFVGGHGVTYNDIVINLARQFNEKGFINFSDHGNSELDMKVASFLEEEKLLVDYVITSNVINAFDHHLDPDKRDEVFACCAKILKQGGKAIHLLEKTSIQAHFNVNLNRSLHNHIGQDLIYSFFREKGPMDIGLDKKIQAFQSPKQFNNFYFHEMISPKTNIIQGLINYALTRGSKKIELIRSNVIKSMEAKTLDGKPDDFRTSMLVMHQTKKTYVTEKSIKKIKETMSSYQHKFNYYNKSVYTEKPGLSLE